MIETDKIILQTALWGLGASWLVWYAFLSVTYIRYLFPPFFIGCMFVAAYLDELTRGFDVGLLIHSFSAMLLKREFTFLNLQRFLVLIALIINITAAIKSAQIGLSLPNNDPALASAYLREHIPPGDIVETFESELFFLAPEVKYHFPSDLVSMQAQRKTVLDPQFPIDYNPLGANPDYLVVGPMGHLWPLYESVLEQGQFQFIADIGDYQIYQKQTSPNTK
jgi:hypothetical protein